MLERWLAGADVVHYAAKGPGVDSVVVETGEFTSFGSTPFTYAGRSSDLRRFRVNFYGHVEINDLEVDGLLSLLDHYIVRLEISVANVVGAQVIDRLAKARHDLANLITVIFAIS